MSTNHRLLHPIKEACRLRGIGRTTAYKLIASGVWDARKSGTRTLVTDESLRASIASLPPAPVRRLEGPSNVGVAE
jgi:excisionase family DNA binding protein